MRPPTKPLPGLLLPPLLGLLIAGMIISHRPKADTGCRGLTERVTTVVATLPSPLDAPMDEPRRLIEVIDTIDPGLLQEANLDADAVSDFGELLADIRRELGTWDPGDSFLDLISDRNIEHLTETVRLTADACMTEDDE